MFSSPGPFAKAESGAGRAEQPVRRREDGEVRARAGSSDGDVPGASTGDVGEAAIDDAVEMTFPASDPPAWMSSGTPGPDAAATDRAGGGA